MIFLSLIPVLAYLVYIYLTRNFDYWPKRGVPSAKPKMFFGNLPNIVKHKRHVTYDMDDIYNEFKGKVPFVGILQIHQPRLVVFEPEVIKDVLVRNFKNFHDNEFSDMTDKDENPFFARNPFFLKGEEWKQKRSELLPAFTVSRLKALYPLIEEVQGRMVNYIQKEIQDDKPLEVRELFNKYTIDAVSNSVFGVDAESFTNENSVIRDMLTKMMAPSKLNILKITLSKYIPFIRKALSVRFVPDVVENFFIDLMNQAIEYREANSVQREDFLDLLIQLQKKKGVEKMDMLGHAIAIYSDGTHTTAVGIAHVLYELARNKRVQDKLRTELNEHFDKDGKINFDALSDMSYLEQIWNEGTRLHPSVTFISRQCNEPIELNYNGQKARIECGINIMIPLYQINRDAEYYNDPEEFIPERFDAAANGGLKAFKDKGVYLTFGDGPRTCLGFKFAQLESKAAIATIIKNFELSVNEKTPRELVIEPIGFLNDKIGGFWLNFKPI